MLSVQRILYGTTDVSLALNDFRSAAYVFAYATTSALYVGAEVPFNHLWIDVSVANVVTAAAAVELWYANAWHAAVDIVDGTAAGGKSLAASGRLQWTPNRTSSWDWSLDSNDVTGLSGTAIYDLYWAKLTWNANLTASTALLYVGQKFASDAELTSFYPDLASTALMAAYKAGKTSWNEQHYMAAEIVARDLIGRKAIHARGQILDHSRFIEPACHKVAEIIYRGIGSAFMPHALEASKRYGSSMNRDFFRVDRDLDARLGERDRRHSQTFMGR